MIKNMAGKWYSHCLKLGAPKISLGIFNMVVKRWNLLDQQTVDAPCLNAFKNSLS